MRFNGFIWWLAAFIFAALAGLLTYGLLSSRTVALASSPKSATQPVVVAAVDIPFRRSIGQSELMVRDYPVASVPQGAATAVEQVLGKMSTENMVAGEPIIMQKLATPDIVTQQVALSVPKGKIVTSVPTESELISNRLVRPGDHIDLLATFKVEVQRAQSNAPMFETVSLLPDLEVHAIVLPTAIKDETVSSALNKPVEEGGVFRTRTDGTQSVLLAVDPQDALTIRHILDVGGLIDLALRGPGDGSAIDTVAVDQFYLADRYQIDTVRGQ
jgi:pilus assembly protein CpaB